MIDRQQNLERTNLKLREGTDEVCHFSRYLQMRNINPKIDTCNSKIILVKTYKSKIILVDTYKSKIILVDTYNSKIILVDTNDSKIG